MVEPKLELTRNRQRLSRLEDVKQTARRRTNRRIELIQDDLAEQRARKEGTTAPADTASTETNTQKPLKQMNKAELREVAQSEQVEVSDDATNAELVSAIEAKRGATNVSN